MHLIDLTKKENNVTPFKYFGLSEEDSVIRRIC